MSVISNPPYPSYFDVDGSPLENGYLYFGAANQNPETNPITVYWDSAYLVPAAQPIRTSGGFAVRNGSPANVYVTTDYSLTVRDKNLRLVYSKLLSEGQTTAEVNIQFSTQTVIATSGQTVFNLSTAYTPGNQSLAVYHNGARLVVAQDYTETSATVVTLLIGATVGDVLQFVTATPINPSSLGAAAVAYVPAGAGAVATNVQDKLRETVSVTDYYSDGDAGDYYHAFTRAYDALPPEGGKIIFPATDTNIFPMSATLNIRKMVHISGQVAQSGTTYVHGTRLEFPAGVSGLIFNAYNTSMYGLITPNQALFPGAYASILENVQVHGNGGSTADGVVMRAGIELRNSSVRGFSRYGVRIYASEAGGTDSTTGNANGWKLDTCLIRNNGGDGVYVDGNDANVGVAIRVSSDSNGGWGFYDNSLIGNTYIGCDTSSNALGPMWSDRASSRVTLIGFWEDGGGLSTLGQNVMAFGGNCGNPSPASKCFEMTYGVALHAPFKHLNKNGAVHVGAQIGVDGTSLAAMAFGATTESSTNDAWKLKFDTTYNVWFLQYANSSLFQPIAYPNSAGALWTAKKFTGPVFQNGYAVKNYGAAYTSAKVRMLGTAAPTTDTYEQGDIVYNSSPSAGGFIGWVCVVGGTPGTWKTFGAISA